MHQFDAEAGARLPFLKKKRRQATIPSNLIIVNGKGHNFFNFEL